MSLHKVSLRDLRMMLVNAECRAVNDVSFIDRGRARDEARRLKARISRREKDEAMRDLGMVKVRGSLGGTYWE